MYIVDMIVINANPVFLPIKTEYSIECRIGVIRSQRISASQLRELCKIMFTL